MRQLRLLRHDERGFALVLALCMMSVLALSVVTLVDYTSSNARSSSYSRTKDDTFAIAEAGINNAMAVLSKPENNALDPDVLPACTGANGQPPPAPNTNGYEGGTVSWCGDLDRAAAVWTVKSTGSFKNPTGASDNITRTLSAQVPVYPTLTQPLNNPVWNYMYATATGNTCDETLKNNVNGGARLYVAGNLCLDPNVTLTQSAVVVQGKLTLSNNAAVGDPSSMNTRVETYVGNGCKYGTATSFDTPCPGDSDHVYSKKNGPSWVAGVSSSPPTIAAPSADFATWYENAIPGPSQSCTTSSGTPPVFDTNYPSMGSAGNGNVATQDLTPSSSYQCRVGPPPTTYTTTLASAVTSTTETTITVASATNFPRIAQYRIKVDNEDMIVTAGQGTTTWTVTRGADGTTAATHSSGATVSWTEPATGEITWNSSSSSSPTYGPAKTLTVSGTIFIDGNVKMANGALNQYNGQATIYVNGSFLLDGKMCGGVSGSNCDFSSWNPNTEMLTIVANGNGGGTSGVASGDSIQLTNNSSFQGSLFGTNKVDFGNNSFSDGPIVGSSIVLTNNVTTQAFANVVTVPLGMPGNPAVYAQPNPPQMFSG